MNIKKDLTILAAITISTDITQFEKGLIFSYEAVQNIYKKVNTLYKKLSKSLKIGTSSDCLQTGLFVNQHELSVIAFLPTEFANKIQKDEEFGIFTDTRQETYRGIESKILAAQKLLNELKTVKENGGTAIAETAKNSIYDNDVKTNGSKIRASSDIWDIAESLQALQELDDLPESGAKLVLDGIEFDMPKSEKFPVITKAIEDDNKLESYIGIINYVKRFDQTFAIRTEGIGHDLISTYKTADDFNKLCDAHKKGKSIEILGFPIVTEGLLTKTENRFKFERIVKEYI